jgi:eukaryotic-like serine/threonine-protein kinase
MPLEPEGGQEDGEGGLAPGATLGRYLIVEELGRGGAGTVYRAFDEVLDRHVALKLLSPTTVGEHDGTIGPGWKKLVAEARMLAKLTAPEVVTVYDVGDVDGRAYLAMELVEGGDLSDWLSRHRGPEAAEPRPLRDALALVLAAGRGLAAAHEAGLVHGDFKPANVLIDAKGRAKVSDFGIARRRAAAALPPPVDDRASSGRDHDEGRTDEPHRSTSTHLHVAGTPAYMAPEQFEGHPADVSTDVHAFGTTLFVATFGVLPFRGRTLAELAEAKAEGRPEIPAGHRAPKWLVRLIWRCMAVARSDRPTSMAEVLWALDRGRKRPRRRTLALGAVATLGVGLVGWMAWMPGHPACATDEANAFPWNDDRRHALDARMAQAFPGDADQAAATAKLIAASLDEYAQRWHSAHGEACANLRALESAGLGGRAFSCLRRRRVATAALLEGWHTADSVEPARATTAVARLGDPGACTDAEALASAMALPEDESLRETVAAVRDSIARAEGLLAAGAFAPALTTSRAALDDARGTDHFPVIAEAEAVFGSALDHAGDYGRARDAMQNAYFTARRADHHEIEARAAEQLTFIVGVRLDAVDEGLLWAANAKIALAKTGGPRGKLLGNEAALLDTKGDFEAAISTYRQALEVLAAEGADVHAVGVTHMRLADALRASGREAESVEHYRKTLSLWHEALGDDHPNVAVARSSLATGLSAAGRDADAIPLFRRAIATLATTFGDDHPNVGSAYVNLGIALRHTGDLEGAARAQRQALDLARGAFGSEHRKTAHRMDALGRTLTRLGEIDEAIELHQAASRIYAASLEPDHPDRIVAMLNLADARWAGGATTEATEDYQHAWEQARDATRSDAPERWMAAAYYGRALLNTGQRDRAVPLLERAVEGLGAVDGYEDAEAVAAFALARALWDDQAHRSRAWSLAAGARGALPNPEDSAQLEQWLQDARRWFDAGAQPE